MLRLSTISMIAIDTVSAASAMRAAARTASPPRTNGIMVKMYPDTNARAIASAIVWRLLQPSAVPITMPSTSPMAQPVRQCSVAVSAVRSSDAPAP